MSTAPCPHCGKLIHLGASALAAPVPIAEFASARYIVEQVSRHTGFSLSLLRGPRRTRSLARARWAIYWLLRTNLKLSYDQIGLACDRDHSTIVHGCRAMERRPDWQTWARSLIDAPAPEVGP